MTVLLLQKIYCIETKLALKSPAGYTARDKINLQTYFKYSYFACITPCLMKSRGGTSLEKKKKKKAEGLVTSLFYHWEWNIKEIKVHVQKEKNV